MNNIQIFTIHIAEMIQFHAPSINGWGTLVTVYTCIVSELELDIANFQNPELWFMQDNISTPDYR